MLKATLKSVKDGIPLLITRPQNNAEPMLEGGKRSAGINIISGAIAIGTALYQVIFDDTT
ncbi:hypothetical protein JCM17795_15890 [Galenea microaerophila]